MNPKNLALTLAAAASIAHAGLRPGDSAIAVAAFVVIASVSVLIFDYFITALWGV